MIFPANNKIIVSVNMKQKDTMKMGDIIVSTALKYEVNYREKSPTVCCVVEGNVFIQKGDIILAHHNTFYTPSPYHLGDDLFSIPATGKVLFAIVKKDGTLKPILGNILCNRVEIPSLLPLPPEKIKTYTDRAIVIDSGLPAYKEGRLIFHRPSAGYDIVYNFNGIEKRVTKIPADQVCGIVSEN